LTQERLAAAVEELVVELVTLLERIVVEIPVLDPAAAVEELVVELVTLLERIVVEITVLDPAAVEVTVLDIAEELAEDELAAAELMLAAE